MINELRNSGIQVTTNVEKVDVVLVDVVLVDFVPDCGSICKMLENASGKTPVYIGKPAPAIVCSS